MNEPSSSSPRKAAAARINGRKGGTKSPDRSRWNALKHGLNSKLSLLEAKHLPEYGEIAALHNVLVRFLEPLSLVELVIVDYFVVATMRLRRALRFELSVTEKAENGMMSDAMPSLLRYLSWSHRVFEKSLARILEICEKRKVSAAAQVSTAVDQFMAGEESLSQELAVAASADSESVNLEPLDRAPFEDPSQGQELMSSTPMSSSSAEASPDASSPAEVPAQDVAAQEDAEPAAGSAGEKTSVTEAEGKSDPRGGGGGAA